MKNPYPKEIYTEALKLLLSFDLDDIDDDGNVRVIVDTIISEYDDNAKTIEKTVLAYGGTFTEDDIEYDGGAEALQDALAPIVNDLNENMPEGMPGGFYTEWENGSFSLMYGGEREEFENL
jgi:hypothetical protein